MATGRYGSIPGLCWSTGTNHACRQARLAPNARCRLRRSRVGRGRILRTIGKPMCSGMIDRFVLFFHDDEYELRCVARAIRHESFPLITSSKISRISPLSLTTRPKTSGCCSSQT